MMKINYIPYTEIHHQQLKEMIHALYEADCEPEKMSADKIDRTIAFLTTNPGAGEIILFEEEGRVVGYSILINYWSNEYGGIVLYIDELYLCKECRGKGAGTEFIRYLLRTQYNQCKALSLEVVPSNAKAMKLYMRLGFRPAHNHTLRYALEA
jgi:GNAT superfamily N-acetyltransferase